MDLRYTPEYDEFRAEVRRFLEESWPLSGAQADLPELERERIFRDLRVTWFVVQDFDAFRFVDIVL